MNLMMISQTAQCWSTDDVSSSLRSEKEIFGIRKGAFDCVCLLSSCSSFVLNYTRCIEKSHLGAVTFG